MTKTQKPLLRWAGGKRWLISLINSITPDEYQNFHEPFVGGGSVFLNIKRLKKVYISDSNEELICFYKQVQGDLKNLLHTLKNFKNDKEFYYDVRGKLPVSEIDKAARFYYLNRMCFNGLYRVNQAGYFNVPFGYRNIEVIENDGFKDLKDNLRNVIISHCDFEIALNKVKKNDLVFLDPPYTVAHNKNGFISYNQKIFSWEDQKRLAECVKKLKDKKAYFIITNAHHDSIKQLYNGLGKQLETERYSTIGQVGSRYKISELIITNCV